MISKPQIKTTIYGAFYRIVRVGEPLEMATFFESVISETWPKSKAPSDWPDFWWESVALEIQSGFMAYRSYLNNLDGPWLKQHAQETWQEVLDYAIDNVQSLDELL
jgi:hypothetical protein